MATVALMYMRQFAESWRRDEIVQAPLGQLPTPEQLLSKCYADAEAQIASSLSAVATKPTVKRSPKKGGVR